MRDLTSLGVTTDVWRCRRTISIGIAIGVAVSSGSALANSALVGSISADAPPAVSSPHYDRASRVFFIGATPDNFAGEAVAQVTVSRAADLVGRPMNMRPIWTSAGSLRSNSLALGAMPSGLPLSRSMLTSGFGMRQHPVLGGWRAHSGLDLAARTGSPIVATSDGRVSTANWHGGYGLLVALDHGGGVQTRYGHMSRLNVSTGQQVRKGDVIGYVGSTGRSTGPHVHYEVRVNGQAVNPLHRAH